MGSSPSKAIGGSSASPSSSEVTLAKPQYIYYRIFSPTGAVTVKNPEFTEDPFLGRTLARRLAPPHNISSLRRHICALEDLKHANLFKTMFATSPLWGCERIHLNSGTASWVGCTPEAAVSCVAPDAGPKYKLIALDSRYDSHEGWISFKKGDILYTDGVPIKKTDPKSGGYWPGFHATDSGGKYGFVMLMYSKGTTVLMFAGQSPTLPAGFESL